MMLELSTDQVLLLLLQLPTDEKLKIAKQLQSSVAAEKWHVLSQNLPNLPEISMDEIVAEVKAARLERLQPAH